MSSKKRKFFDFSGLYDFFFLSIMLSGNWGWTMTGIFQQYQQLMSRRTETPLENDDFSSGMKKLVAALGGMKVSGTVQSVSSCEQLIAQAGELSAVDQTALAERVVSWHSGFKVLESVVQGMQLQNEMTTQGQLEFYETIKSKTAYNYLHNKLYLRASDELQDMDEKEIEGLIIAEALKFDGELASLCSGREAQIIIEHGGEADLSAPSTSYGAGHYPSVTDLKKKTVYDLLKEKIIEDRKARGQMLNLSDDQWDVLVRTKSDVLNEVKYRKKDLQRTHDRVSKGLYRKEESEEQYKKKIVEERKGKTEFEEKDSLYALSMVDLTSHFNIVKKIENVLVKSMQRPRQAIEKEHGTGGISRFLNMDELLELYLCLNEWNKRMPPEVKISYINNLEQLLKKDYISLNELRKLFPVKESGVVKEEEDDGFVLVEAGSRRLSQLKGMRSQALQRLIQSKE